MCRSLALLSYHGCPVARLGEKDTGGMNVYVLQLAREYARRGNRVDVFTRYHDPNDPKIVEIEEGARVIHLEAGPLDASKNDLFSYIPDFLDGLYLFQREEQTRYDLIHSHYWLSGMVGATLSREWDAPHVATFHTLAKTKMRARPGEREPQLRQDVEAHVMSVADGVVVSTDEERQDVIRHYDAPPRNVHVIPAGVDLDMFQPVDQDAARAELGIGKDERVILYVGRIEPLKGIDILLRAVPMLEYGQNLKVLIVGGKRVGESEGGPHSSLLSSHSSELDRLKSLAFELGVSDRVTFTGSVPQETLPAYYSAADVFVLPSHSESFGLAPLEAMACGTPVVVSRVGGMKTFVNSGENGYLVPWRCPESFAQRLDVLLANPELRNAMGRAARDKALDMGWDSVADRMLAYYATHIHDSWPALAGD